MIISFSQPFVLQATYFDVEEGTATASLVATSSVVSSTVAPGSSTKASGTGTATGSAVSAGTTSGALQLVSSPIAAFLSGLIILIL